MVLLRPRRLFTDDFSYGDCPGEHFGLGLEFDPKASPPCIIRLPVKDNNKKRDYKPQIIPSIHTTTFVYDIYENFLLLDFRNDAQGIILKLKSSNWYGGNEEIVDIHHPALTGLLSAFQGHCGLFIERVMPQSILYNWERVLSSNRLLTMVQATKEDRVGHYDALYEEVAAPPDGVGPSSPGPMPAGGAASAIDNSPGTNNPPSQPISSSDIQYEKLKGINHGEHHSNWIPHLQLIEELVKESREAGLFACVFIPVVGLHRGQSAGIVLEGVPIYVTAAIGASNTGHLAFGAEKADEWDPRIPQMKLYLSQKRWALYFKQDKLMVHHRVSGNMSLTKRHSTWHGLEPANGGCSGTTFYQLVRALQRTKANIYKLPLEYISFMGEETIPLTKDVLALSDNPEMLRNILVQDVEVELHVGEFHQNQKEKHERLCPAPRGECRIPKLQVKSKPCGVCGIAMTLKNSRIVIDNHNNHSKKECKSTWDFPRDCYRCETAKADDAPAPPGDVGPFPPGPTLAGGATTSPDVDSVELCVLPLCDRNAIGIYCEEHLIAMNSIIRQRISKGFPLSSVATHLKNNSSWVYQKLKKNYSWVLEMYDGEKERIVIDGEGHACNGDAHDIREFAALNINDGRCWRKAWPKGHRQKMEEAALGLSEFFKNYEGSTIEVISYGDIDRRWLLHLFELTNTPLPKIIFRNLMPVARCIFGTSGIPCSLDFLHPGLASASTWLGKNHTALADWNITDEVMMGMQYFIGVRAKGPPTTTRWAQRSLKDFFESARSPL